MQPRICIITPTKNVIQYLDRFFQAINRINYPKDRIIWIFADGESSDGTFEYLKNKKIKFRKVVITKRNSTRPNTRNEAYSYILKKKISHDFIATVDADVLLYPEFFNKLLRHFDDKKVGMASSYFMYTQNKFLKDYTDSYLGNKMGKVISTGFCPTGCAIFRRGCYDFFDETFECHEDGDLSISITEKGWSGIQDFTKTCSHIKNQTIKKEFKELCDMGYYEPLLWLKHPKYFWNKKTFLGSLYYILTAVSIPLFVLTLTGLLNKDFLFLMPVLIFLSILTHFHQIKNKSTLRRIVYSFFTTTRFITYFTAVIYRLVKLPFQRFKFRKVNIEKCTMAKQAADMYDPEWNAILEIQGTEIDLK